MALEIRDLVVLTSKLEWAEKQAAQKAMLATVRLAESYAKRNLIQNLKESEPNRQRTLSGTLLNSIYSGMEQGKTELIGYLGVRNVPYGAIHEFGSKGLPGGVIRPTRAKNLWIPQYKNMGGRRITPREFVNLMRANPGQYYISPGVGSKVAGKITSKKPLQVTPYFFLVDSVRIPERPYLRPAIAQASEKFEEFFMRFLGDNLSE